MVRAYVLRAITLVIVFWLCVFARNPAAQVATTTVMTGLDNPRGLALDAAGVLYVAEAGKGGTSPCRTARGQSVCYGATGAVTRLRDGQQQRYISGLPSLISTTGEVVGPNDLAVTKSGVYVITGVGGDPAEVRAAYGSSATYLGKLLYVTRGGIVVPVDLASHELRQNPAGGPIDTNPFGLLLDSGEGLIADAGANAIFRVESGGRVSTFAVLSSSTDRPFDPVPTTVVRGPDGAYYVGQLTGAPFIQGAARVYRLTAGGSPQVFLEGFKAIIDMAFDPSGNLYVLEHASGAVGFAGPGQLLRIAPNGARSVVIGGLDRPTSVLVDDGAIFVTNHGISVGGGEVLRIPH